jgi:hypothetical protein
MKHLKSYKLFESLDKSDFLKQEDIEELFYDLTDEEGYSTCQISDFGYRFFTTDFITRPIRSQMIYDMEFSEDWINKECNDIQDTWKNLFIDLSQSQSNSSISLARRNDNDVYSSDKSYEYKWDSLITKNILDGKIHGYKVVILDLGSFNPDKLPIVIECLQRLYDVTGFRPTSKIWDEDYADEDNGDIVTLRRASLKLYKVNDVEYSNLCKIETEGKLDKELIKYFL